MTNERIRPHIRKSTSVDYLEINEEKITHLKDILNALGDYFSNIGFRLVSTMSAQLNSPTIPGNEQHAERMFTFSEIAPQEKKKY